MRTYLLALLVFAAPLYAQELAPAAPASEAVAAAAPASDTAAAPAPRKAAPDYVLGPGDILKVTVFGETAPLSASYKIDSDGAFEYPFLKRVAAEGKTVRQVETEIRTRLADGWVRDPQVNVDIDQYRTRNINIVGEVKSPGKYPLIGQVTVLEALAQAGYLTATAGTEVLVLHATLQQQASGKALSPDQTPSERVTHVNFAQIQEGKLADNIILQEGDTILVPKAQRFYVMGQVKTSGPFTWEPGLTLRQALALAGGITEKGSDRRIKVIRIVDGKEKKFDMDMDDIVQPEDTIEVPQRLL
jgi:polysaccharide export outer membrane protein